MTTLTVPASPENVLTTGPGQDSAFSQVYVQTKLAVEFGDGEHPTLSEWLQKLDDELAGASIWALKAIKSNRSALTDFNQTMTVLNNSDGLIQAPDTFNSRVNRYTRDTQDDFKFDGSPSSADVEALKIWFQQQVNAVDPKIYNNSEIVKNGVVERLAKIASETGARVHDFESFFSGHEEKRERVLELSIIRFPDKANPHVHLFRIEVYAWFSCDRILFHGHNKSGMDVDIKSVKYKLNPAIADKVGGVFAAKAKEKMADDEFFNF